MSTPVSEPEIDALVQPYRAMFAWVNFDTQFLPSGPHSQARTFHVPGEPRYTGYLLIQAQDVESGSHAIGINGQDLPSFDLVPDATSGHWKVWDGSGPSRLSDTGHKQDRDPSRRQRQFHHRQRCRSLARTGLARSSTRRSPRVTPTGSCLAAPFVPPA